MSAELEKVFGEFNYVTDEDRGAQILHEWIKFSPNIKALVNTITPELQELHDAQKDVYANINIFEAIGSQLDDIFGNLLDLERIPGQSDAKYRTVLLARITVLSRSGDIVTLKGLYRSLTGSSLISLIEFQSAAFKMNAVVTVIPSTLELALIRETLESAKQGGNQLLLSINNQTEFTLGNLSSPELNSQEGLSEGAFTGGILSEGF